jgi:hypothetical protein
MRLRNRRFGGGKRCSMLDRQFSAAMSCATAFANAKNSAVVGNVKNALFCAPSEFRSMWG